MVILSLTKKKAISIICISSLLKGRPVYIGLAVDLSEYEVTIDPTQLKPLNVTIARNPKEEHEAALEAVIENAKRAENIVVIVDAYV